MHELDHSNIIIVHEYFEDDKNLYVVTEYCEGGNLFDYLTKKMKKFSEL
jgi:calcium-dependent protein kinase